MKDTAYRKLIVQLFADQALGVLSTQQDNKPYANLVAFACSEGLTKLVFVTATNTRKFSNLQANANVALLVDSRANASVDFRKAVAVTACGAAVVAGEVDIARFTNLFLAKHQHMKAFVDAPSTALFVMDVEEYTVVDHFQHVVKIDVSKWNS